MQTNAVKKIRQCNMKNYDWLGPGLRRVKRRALGGNILD